MAEFINRDLALSHPFANGHYDRENANDEFIFGHESYREWLEDLPYVDMNKWTDVLPVGANRWIPVGERLPKKYDDVLVCFEYYRYGNYNCLFQTIGIGTYYAEHEMWMINHETGWRQLRVIAWMPLPEPYREEETT